MSMQITIIGLDRTGLSIGLALKKRSSSTQCIGFDINPDHLKTALEVKAVDKTESRLPSAVGNADVVLLNSLPVDVAGWMDDICGYMKQGAVLVNLASLHRQACKWAEADPSRKCSIVNASISINGNHLNTEEESADLFDNGIMIISTPKGAREEAVQQVLDLAALLGVSPMFADALEADGLISQSQLFPRLLALLYIQGLSGQSGWADARKVTGTQFWQMSKLLYEFTSGKSAAFEIDAHKDSMLHLLDMMREQIDNLEDSMRRDDLDNLTTSVQKILDEHGKWMSRRVTGDWEGLDAQLEVKSEGMWKKLFGMGLPKKRS